jgi:hypothetical protein
VKKTLSIAFALVMILAMLPAAVFAAPGDTVWKTVGFHCSDTSGGSKIDIANYDGSAVQLEDLGGGTWKLVRTDFVCDCGKSEWVAYSNQDGKLTGKNIQLVHPGSASPPTGSLSVTANADLTVTTSTRYEIWQKEITPYREDVQWLSQAYSSVTATTFDQFLLKAKLTDLKTGNLNNKDKEFNDLVVKNANHFTFAKLSVAALEQGVDLTLVVGNKIDKVGAGQALITADGKLQLTFGDDLYAYKFGAVASSAPKKKKNGNVHSEKIFSHNNNGIIDLPAPDKDGYIYLYVHFDSLQYKKNFEEGYRTWEAIDEYWVEDKIVESIGTPLALEVKYTVYDCDDLDCACLDCAVINDLDNLTPSTYKVVYTVYNPDGTLRDVVSTLETVVADKTTYATFSNHYAETEGPIDGGIEWLPEIMNPTIIITITKVK